MTDQFQKLSIAVEQSANSIIITDINGNIEYVNKKFIDISGYSFQEVLGKNPRILKTNYKSKDEYKELWDTILSGKEWNGVFCNRNKKGEIYWESATISPIKNENGDLINFLAIKEDITLTKKLENELVENQKMLSTLMSNLPGLVYRCLNDHDWTMIFVNEGIKQLTAYEADDLLYNKKISFNQIILEEDREQVWENAQLGLNSKANYQLQYRILTADKKIKWVFEQAIGIYNENGNLEYIEGFITDITERKNAERIQDIIFNISNAALKTKNINQFLKEIQSNLNEIIDTTNFFVGFYNKERESLSLPFMVDDKDKFEEVPLKDTLSAYVINSGQPLFARDKDIEKLEQKGIVKLVGSQSKVWLGVPLKIDEEVFGIIVVQSYTNKNLYTKKDLNLLEFVSGQIASVIARKQYEEQLITAKEKAEESDRLKTVFLSNMSHEVRTPMNAIIGFSNLLKDNTLTEEERNEYIDIISNRTVDLLNIITNIIDISRFETGTVEVYNNEFNIRDLFVDLYEYYQKVKTETNKSQIELNLALSEESNKIITDYSKLKQIINNLLNNAFKFTEKGQISFGYEFDLIQKEIKVFIKDSGKGIADDKKRIIFNSFRQATEGNIRVHQGLGLGLSISKKIVELLNGKIWVESTENVGSTFYFTIPLIFAKVEEIKQVASNKPLDLTNKKILIAEDIESNYLLLETAIKRTNASIIWAKNGKEAVEIAINQKIDLILMDINMPVMDGATAAKIIKEHNENQIIIAQTAFSDMNEANISKKYNCDEILHKPISLKNLNQLLKTYLQ